MNTGRYTDEYDQLANEPYVPVTDEEYHSLHTDAYELTRDQLAGEIASLRSRNEFLSDTIMQREIERTAEIDRYVQLLNDVTAQHAILRESLTDAHRLICRQDLRLSLVEPLKRDFENKIAQGVAEIQRLKNLIPANQALTEENISLTRESQRQATEIKRLETALQQRDQQKSSLSNRICNTKRGLENAQAEIARLQALLAAKNEEADSATKKQKLETGEPAVVTTSVTTTKTVNKTYLSPALLGISVTSNSIFPPAAPCDNSKTSSAADVEIGAKRQR